MRTSRRAGVVAGALTLALAAGSGAGAVAAADPGLGGSGFVYICHRTSSLAHPYKLVKVRRDSVQFTRHLQHRAYSDRHGFRDLIDGVDGRFRALADCPEWWDLQDRNFKPYKPRRNGLKNKQQKLKQRQGQDLHIHLYDNESAKKKHRTYKRKKIKAGQRPAQKKRVQAGVRDKRALRS